MNNGRSAVRRRRAPRVVTERAYPNSLGCIPFSSRISLLPPPVRLGTLTNRTVMVSATLEAAVRQEHA